MLWFPARLAGDRQRQRKEVIEEMTGAMYAALGGLKSHMSKLNVIGNNIANVNTYGYKAQRMSFKESMYTTSRSGSNGGATAGGNNPSQVGYGTMVGSIDLNMSPSTYAPTGWGLDTYIDGEGFFMVGDKDGNIMGNSDLSKLDLSRVGDFWVDPEGYICNRDGKCLYGFARVQNPDYIPNPTEKDKTDAAAAKPPKDITSNTIIISQLVPLRVPLSAAAPTEKNGGLIPGNPNATPPTEDSYLWDEGDPVYPYLVESTSADGKTYMVNQYAEPNTKATIPGANNNNPGGGGGGGGGAAGTVPDTPSSIVPGEDTDPLSTSGVLHVQLKSMGVEKNGAITGIAANGETVILGYIAIANVDSPDGVTHIDGPYYKAMGGAGKVRVSALNGVLEGKYLGNQVIKDDVPPDPADAIVNEKAVELRDGGLEASSTDVAEEFSQMITTQRGYQANTRIVTVTDSMLEELVNMKR